MTSYMCDARYPALYKYSYLLTYLLMTLSIWLLQLSGWPLGHGQNNLNTERFNGVFISLVSPHRSEVISTDIVSSELSVLWLIAALVNWVMCCSDPVYHGCDCRPSQRTELKSIEMNPDEMRCVNDSPRDLEYISIDSTNRQHRQTVVNIKNKKKISHWKVGLLWGISPHCGSSIKQEWLIDDWVCDCVAL